MKHLIRHMREVELIRRHRLDLSPNARKRREQRRQQEREKQEAEQQEEQRQC